MLQLVQVLKLKPALWSFILQSESTDEEHFEDVVVPEGNDHTSLSPRDSRGARRNHVTMEEKKRTIAAEGKLAGSPGDQSEGRQLYLMSHRNPSYCGAEGTCLWELASVSGQFWCHNGWDVNVSPLAP